MTVQKTIPKRVVVTMDIGAFYAKETVLECSCYCKPVFRSEELQNLVPYRCTFGFDVLVYVGKAIFVRFRNNREIKMELAQKNVVISEEEIGYLSKKFIIYLALAHRESRKQLRMHLAQNGGYILHLDGTCDGDSPHLFTVLDGIAKIVLENIKIPSEKADVLIPFLQKVKENYGIPIALVHDMGKGILAAIKEVFPSIADFICHFHFLRDIGKDLMEDEYKIIRNRLKALKIRSQLKQRAKYLEQKIDFNSHSPPLPN